MAELAKIARAEVGQLVMFPVAPDVFDRIEFRGVGRQALDREPARLVADELRDQPRPVLRQPVPDHQQLARQVAQQMAEEVDHLGGMDGAGIEPEVEVPPGDAGSRRQHLPVEMMLQYRGLPARRPGPHPMRSFAQSAFVDEDDRAPLAEGFFLIRGHATFFHWRIACSSRSSARPLGRWQVQLSLRRMRQTWSSWYRTPVRYSMRSRTRLAVHSPLANPNASGPRLSARSRSRNWAALSLGGRPVRLAWRSPRTPDCSSACAQRLTDCRWTPTARATWDWLSPCRSNRAASIRRASNAAKSRRTPAGLPMPYTLTESRDSCHYLMQGSIRAHRNVCEKEKEAAVQYQVARIYLFIIVPASTQQRRTHR